MTNRFTLPTVTALAALAASGLAVVGLAAVPAAAAPAAPATGADSEFSRAVEAALAETGDGVVTSFEAGRSGYDVEVHLADGSDVDVDIDTGFAVVRVRPDVERDDNDPVAETVDLARAYDAVIAHIANERVGTGTVASIELDDHGGYDADVTLDDGAEIEVQLDDTFDVLRMERDDD